MPKPERSSMESGASPPKYFIHVAQPPQPWAKTPGGRRTLFAVAAVSALVALALGSLLLAQDPDAGGDRFVKVYLTDLAGDFDAVEVDLAAVTACQASHPLHLLIPTVPLSALHGPADAMPIAEGLVPQSCDGAVSIVFSQVRGLRDGAPVELRLPENRLSVLQACPVGPYLSCASILDVDLDASLVLAGDAWTFRPQVQAASIHIEEPRTSLDLHAVLSDLDTIQHPSQGRDLVGPEALGRILQGTCPALGCPPLPAGTRNAAGQGADDMARSRLGVGPSPSTTATNPCASNCPNSPPATSAAPTTTTTTTQAPVNHPPAQPSNPSPADGSTGQGESVTLSWNGTDPDGDPLQYLVEITTESQPWGQQCAWQTATTCRVDGLQPGHAYQWRVTARDPSGAKASSTWNFSTPNDGLTNVGTGV